jgi:hypothetical protein
MNEIIKIKSDYFYKTQTNQFSFIRIPKELVTGEMFSCLSIPTKILYGMMLDRMSFAGRNQWLDSNNRAYIIYPVADIQADMNISKRKASDYLNELEGIGLIKREQQGKGLPNQIYVMNFADTN